MRPMTRSIRRALAAAAACASSRCSSAARHPDTSHLRARSPSGSTRHDQAEYSPETRARANRSIAGSRLSASHAHQTPPNHPPRRTASRKCAFSRRSNPNSNNQHDRPATAPSCTRSIRYSQIPIARHRPQSPAGSFPGGFRTTAPAPAAAPTMGPSSETHHRSRPLPVTEISRL